MVPWDGKHQPMCLCLVGYLTADVTTQSCAEPAEQDAVDRQDDDRADDDLGHGLVLRDVQPVLSHERIRAVVERHAKERERVDDVGHDAG